MTFRPLPFTVEVYTKTSQQSEAGQPIHVWTLSKTVKCDFMGARNEERLVGSIENPQSYIFWVSDLTIKTSHQLKNLKDRYGNVIVEGPFNVTGVKIFRGFSKAREARIVGQEVLN